MFRIIGSDQRLYGPVSAETIRQWIAEGRVNATTLIQPDGSAEWKPVSEFAEFAAAAIPPVTPGFQAPPSSAQPQPQPQYQFPPITAYPYGVPPVDVNGTATWGFVFGLLSVFCCCNFLFGVPGLVLSIIALNRANQSPGAPGKSLALAGLIFSILGLLEGVSIPFLGLLTHPHGSWGFHF